MSQEHIIDRTPPQAKLIIGDRELSTASGGSFTHINPATGNAQAEIPLAGATEMNDAVACAKAASEAWKATPPTVRRDLLNKLADLIADNAPELQRLATIEGGTPFHMGSGATMIGDEWIRYYAGWADKLDGQVVSHTPGGELIYTVPEPYGVIGIIITWNGPLISLGMKAAPALAAGNTVVIKPADQTPFVAMKFAQLALEAGFPPGVVNVLPGTVEAAETLIGHPDVEKITFTGGPATARKILSQCAQHLNPAVLELGGKSANIIFDDADIAQVSQYAAFMSVLLCGQGCELPTRLLVQDSIYEHVVEAVVTVIKHLKPGDPWDSSSNMGPLINEAACERVLGMIKQAVDSNAGELLVGGERLTLEGELANGCFMQPTVFGNVDPKSHIAQNEVFGPVLVIHKFSTEAEAIAIANGTQYSLGAYIQTNDHKRANRLAAAIKAGSVHINGTRNIPAWAPFGGYGLSGYGKEGGRQGIEEFVRYKSVSSAP